MISLHLDPLSDGKVYNKDVCNASWDFVHENIFILPPSSISLDPIQRSCNLRSHLYEMCDFRALVRLGTASLR